ncbi:SusC/RagA family TonB-linked outer membrane protein [Thalassobellus suaedae]|uniref:TonB-dependent receptor n=1 Tax=Thalassobellus suaedae TaxID=3074124 RepID=A0ABY9XZQ4_9FLAO|nr:TonB-dependent receptor [Flavobacteriaceae bacterium HL-DH10]
MKTFILLFCTSVFSLSSGDIFSQDSKIEIEKDDVVTIDEIFDLLRTQTNYTFIYQEDLFKDTPKVQIKKGTIKTNKLLKQTLSSVDFNFDFSTNNKIVITKVKQQNQISGLVTDGGELGGPLPGVTVLIKGTTNGTSTDFDGNYTLNNVASNAVLVFSYIGYKTQEVPVNNQKSINITLETDVSQLDEIVIVNYGYGKVKKTDMTGASASINSKELLKIPVSSASEAISGRLPGVNITTADGEPGSAIRIRVRGGTSLSQDNNPLIIVDGFIVGSMEDVPVNDIESITVLKDASATAVYGAQASNGVIVVTTKNPVAGKTTIAYNNYFQYNELPENRKYNVLTPYEYTLANYEFAALQSQTSLDRFQKLYGAYGDLELYKNRAATDWQEELFGGSRLSQLHNLNISGGTEMTKMNLSISHNNDEGLLEGSAYERTAINFKLNQKISEKLSLDVSTRITNSIKDGAGTSSKAQVKLQDIIQQRPINGLSDELELDLTQVSDDDDFANFIRDLIDPRKLVEQDWRKGTSNQYVFNAALTWKILEDLTFKTTINTSREFEEELRFYGPLTGESRQRGRSLPLGQKTNDESSSYRWVNTLNYKKEWVDSKIDILLGQEISSVQGKSNFVRAEEFRESITPQELFANMQLGTGEIQIETTDNTDFNRKSYFGRFDFQLQNKYIWTLTARADQSSKFQGKNNLGIFPAIAFGWKIDKENFMKSVNFVDELKFRISYGETGNDRIPAGSTVFTFKSVPTRGAGFNNIDNNYYTPNSKTLYNPDLKWETTTTNNLGLDFTMFNKRLNGSFDYYKNETRDLLYKSRIDQTSGFADQWDNVGTTSNEGIELGLTAYIIDSKDFTFSANFNIGLNDQRIVKLDGTSSRFSQSNWASTDLRNIDDYYLETGGKIGNIYGFVTDGFYTTDDFESYDPVTEKYILKSDVANGARILGRGDDDLAPGYLKLKDVKEDGVIDDDDRKVIGNALPDFQGGFGFNFRYKNFDLSTFFNYQVGNDVYNTGKIQFNSLRRVDTKYGNMLDNMSIDNRFTYLDVDGSITGTAGGIVTDLSELATLNEGKNMWSHTSFRGSGIPVHSNGIEDGSFLRLNNVTIGYNLPEKLISRFGLSKFRVFATGRNLALWTKYSGYDPEVNTDSDPFTPGLDYSSYPRSRSYTLGLNVTF